MGRDEDLDVAVEETVCAEQLAVVLWRQVWNSVGVLGVAHWDRPPSTPVAGRIEASGHCGGDAWEGAVDRVVCAGASLVEYLSVSGVVQQVILPSSPEVTVIVKIGDRIPSEGAQRLGQAALAVCLIGARVHVEER